MKTASLPTPERGRARLRLKVVSNLDELHQAFGLRRVVYIGEQSCPIDEEFDGNDFAATQIIGHIDGEPVATARIRWFASFAKLERLAIRREWRGLGYGHELLQFLIWLARAKGFCRLYLHAQARLEPFYAQYGFERRRGEFAFSDHHYVEMVAAMAPSETRLSLDAGPMVLNRPEGAWNEEGVLERSIERLVAPAAA
jgi:predicted GNAT family N-acyltransferase